MKAAPLKRAPTFFLKAVVVLIGAAVFALCAFVFPQIYGELSEWKATQYAPAIYAAWIGLFASPIPFYLALCQVFKLLHFIDKNNAFSELSNGPEKYQILRDRHQRFVWSLLAACLCYCRAR
jgi:hypothetical protein